MYADRVSCCPLVSHVDYVLRAIYIRLEKDGTGKQTGRPRDGRTSDRYNTLSFSAIRDKRNKVSP